MITWIDLSMVIYQSGKAAARSITTKLECSDDVGYSPAGGRIYPLIPLIHRLYPRDWQKMRAWTIPHPNLHTPRRSWHAAQQHSSRARCVRGILPTLVAVRGSWRQYCGKPQSKVNAWSDQASPIPGRIAKCGGCHFPGLQVTLALNT